MAMLEKDTSQLPVDGCDYQRRVNYRASSLLKVAALRANVIKRSSRHFLTITLAGSSSPPSEESAIDTAFALRRISLLF